VSLELKEPWGRITFQPELTELNHCRLIRKLPSHGAILAYLELAYSLGDLYARLQ
jgi:hypothetical protein